MILLAAVLFMGFVLRNTDDLSPNLILMIMLCMGVYVLFFLNAAGEWGREIMKPYLYMVPASPLKKLIWASLTSITNPRLTAWLFLWSGNPGKGFPADSGGVRPDVFQLWVPVHFQQYPVSAPAGADGEQGIDYSAVYPHRPFADPARDCGRIGALFWIPYPGAVMGIPVAVWNIGLSFGIYAICQNTLHNMETH